MLCLPVNNKLPQVPIKLRLLFIDGFGCLMLRLPDVLFYVGDELMEVRILV